MRERKGRMLERFALLLVLIGVVGCPRKTGATDYPHNPENWIECTSCHRIKGAPGTRLTLVGGIVNLCKLCHSPTGSASRFTLDYADQALPGTSGTSHGFEVPPDQAGYGAQPPGDPNMARNLENGKVVCTTCHNVHNHRNGFPFLWTARTLMCQSCHGVRWQTTPPYSSHPVGIPVPNRPDYQMPPHLELPDGKVACLSCHGVHFTYSRTQYRGIAEAGSDVCLSDNDAAWTPGTLVGWELKVLSTAGSDPRKWYQRRIITSNTADTVCWSDPLPTPITAGDPYVLKERGTGDGYLLNQTLAALCTQCHSFPAGGSHFTSPAARWPGGQYGSDYAYTDSTGTELWPPARGGTSALRAQPVPASLTGTCFSCHWPHGWPDGSGGVYPRLTVDREERLCYTCHDGNPAATDVRTAFEQTLWVTLGVGQWNNLNLNTRHDVRDADQAQSGAKIECIHCYDPHRVSGANPPASRLVPDPDPTDGRVPAPGQTWADSDFQSEWCLDCHDGSYPPTVQPPTNALMNIRDSYTDGGSYGPDVHGTDTGNPRLKTGYGWARGDTVPCTACHDPRHQSTNLFQLRTVVLSKDGTQAVPSDCGPGYSVTNNATTDTRVNGWCWCNTCHTGSMGTNKNNCFASGCHHHGRDL